MTELSRVPLDTLPTLPNVECDLLLACVSFDPRSIIGPTAFAPHAKSAVIFCEVPDQDVESDHLKKIGALFGERLSIVGGYEESPLDFADFALRAVVDPLQKAEKVVVDITGFTTETLLILLRIIQILGRDGSSIKFVYISAREYSQAKGGELPWLSKGVTEVRTVLGYSGGAISDAPLHLILMAGIEMEAARSAIASLDPQSMCVGYADTAASINQDIAKRNKEIADQILKASSVQGSIFQFSCVDPFSTADSIKRCLPVNFNGAIVLVPLSNKIATVGAFLFCQDNEEVQVQYVRPQHFNRRNYCAVGSDAVVFDFVLKSGKIE